ncbi:glucosyl-3-phosphoglycerate synthase [Salinispora arenicola]|uniref:Glucosyl-3-phosphoglycerate synthase n=2 Tax=Salinispora arenicola TaxID=168697 RepID=A0A542XHH2_SALAC|nr:glucosyl-3-phosphoglycerate synthase [Salinispora arenicola]GIM85997.1 glucosyl-3-phosphoglycerate synthase [Salinispora arenicola]
MRDTEPTVSPVVDAWTKSRTSSAQDWHTERLMEAKGENRVSVVLPAYNEEATTGPIVSTIREHLMEQVPLVDELVVVDSRSTDRTAEVARAAGAEVVSQDEVTQGLPRLTGKGDALWAGLAATDGNLVAFVDADLREFRPHFVRGLLGPLLTHPSIDFVKGFYHRPLEGQSGPEEDNEGGRVTELMVRPLLNMFWPELAGFVQPLAGEYAGRRQVLEQLPFITGYGVETAMLVDLLELVGLDALSQVDLGIRKHRHQDTEALGRMSAQIMHTVWARLQQQGWAVPGTSPATLLAQFRRGDSEELPNLDREIVVNDVSVQERAPLQELRHLVPRR